jgi:hypothetical protein
MAQLPNAQTPQDEDRASYYYEQLFTILTCGALAAVTLMLYQSGTLMKMLDAKFHIYVILCGVFLMALVILRAIAVWQSVDELPQGATGHEGHSHGAHPHGEHKHDENCGHDHGQDKGHSHSEHKHDENCDHGHDHGHEKKPDHAASHSHSHSHSHGHGHGHDHDHGGAFWRYLILLFPVILYFLVLSNPSYNREPIPTPKEPLEHIQNFIILFRSILWEALPFILLGAIIAGLLEEFLPQGAVTAAIPKNRFLAIALGGMLGIVFPMCECGIIPIMRRLLRKGLPLSCCVAYLLAGPIVNIIVMLSTYAAFSGMENVFEGDTPSYQMGGFHMMLFRVGMGYLIAVITGLIVDGLYKKHGDSLLMPIAQPSKLPMADDAEPQKKGTLWQRTSNVTETALHDFVDITVFLILGALLAATARLFLTNDQISEIGRAQPMLAILLMMGLAVVLCLCSEADAFVAASFVTLRPSAKLAFLVLGPMMDFKLYFMYTRIFKPRLIITIYLSVVLQVFLYCTITHYFWDNYAQYIIDPQKSAATPLSEKELQYGANKAGTFLGLMANPYPGGQDWASATSAAAMLMVSGSNEAPELRFTQLENAARTETQRNFYEGKRISLIGRFRGSETQFTLTRYTITCCAADAQPLNVPMFVVSETEKLPAQALQDRWVKIVGIVRFARDAQGVYRTGLILTPNEREPLLAQLDATGKITKPGLVEVLANAPANPYVD